MGYARIAAGAPPTPTAVSTDSAGVASLNGLAGEYTVVVAMGGFVPEIRAIEVAPGCSGTLKVVLSVALRERLEAPTPDDQPSEEDRAAEQGVEADEAR